MQLCAEVACLGTCPALEGPMIFIIFPICQHSPPLSPAPPHTGHTPCCCSCFCCQAALPLKKTRVIPPGEKALSVDRFNKKIIYVPCTNKHTATSCCSLVVSVLCCKSQGPRFNSLLRHYVLCIFLMLYDRYDMVCSEVGF